jgi:glycosyltransferase involved in cell wall biosynthesis
MTPGEPDARVHFHVGRWGHPFFTEQLGSAPEGFRYQSADAGSGGEPARVPRRIVLEHARLARARELGEQAAVRVLASAGYVRRRRLAPEPACALVHSAQLLLRNATRPYVLDFECVEVFCLYQRIALRRPWARRHLLAALSDERCRFLLPWSEASRRGIGSALGERAAELLAPKTVTVLPSIAPRVERPGERGSGPLRVLFVGTAFEAKGGVEAIRAVARARESHEVALDVVSNVPPRWRQEAERGAGIVLHDWPVSGERLRQLFGATDLLLFPSHMDTLGFAMLEAMAYGAPVVASGHFAAPELVEDGVSGLLVDGENPLYGQDGLSRFDYTLPLPGSFRRALAAPSEHYVARIASALTALAEDRDLHRRLAAGALARVTDGALSVPRRREALASVYTRAVEPGTVDMVTAR